MNLEAGARTGARDIKDDRCAMLARNELGAAGLEARIGLDDGAPSSYHEDGIQRHLWITCKNCHQWI